jgi:hypothetical protein
MVVMRRKHKQSLLKLSDGSRVAVDSGVRELISAMNVPGLRTLASCQGRFGCEWDGHGYVSFEGSLAKPFMCAVLRRWLKPGVEPLDGLSFENYRTSFVIRWNRRDFRKLLRCASGAMSEVKQR